MSVRGENAMMAATNVVLKYLSVTTANLLLHCGNSLSPMPYLVAER
jgi:hypothetical protein